MTSSSSVLVLISKGGLAYALSGVKQEEQIQVLKLLSEGRGGLTVIRDYFNSTTTYRRKELLFGYALLVVVWPKIQVLKLLDARTRDNI